MSHVEHEQKAPTSVICAVVTISDTRTVQNDTSGRAIKELLQQAGHEICSYDILKDDPGQIRGHIEMLAAGGACQAILLTGGTGIAPRDQTYETVSALFEKRLDGFGEIFRTISFQEIGPAAMMSRAVAGTYRRRIVFSMPGSTGAVRTAMSLILPQLGHLVYEMTKS